MKLWIKYFGLLLCLCLALTFCACGNEQGNGATVNTTAPSTPPTETTVPPTTEPDPLTLYKEACDKLAQQDNLVIRFDLKKDRLIGSQSYQETSKGDAYYMGLGTAEMEALVREELSFSGFENSYVYSYIAGAGYCRVDNYNFTCDMTADAFVAQQLPAVLVHADLYGAVEYIDNGNATYTFRFSAPSALESWVDTTGAAQLVSAQGSVTMTAANKITASDYTATYTVGNVSYSICLSITVETPDSLDFDTLQPVYPDDCPSLNDLTIPRLMLQTVGELYATESITASYTDTLYSTAFAVVRSQNGSFDTWGTSDDFMCAMDTQVIVTDYTGNSNSNSQAIKFRDGVYRYSTNGGEEKESDAVTAEDVRISCEDAILSSLFELGYIRSATIKDTGDFLQITFDSNEEFAESLCDSIYGLFSMDLDDYADSYENGDVGAYLYINKYTGLATAMGMNLERTHTIAGAPYEMTYQLDQTLELPSGSSYTNITGQPEEPPLTLDRATPVFYKVTGKDGETLWLLGTIHAGDHKTAMLPTQITEAFADADALAVEFDINAFEEALLTDTNLVAELTDAYYYSDGSKYSSHLSKDLRKQLSLLIKASGNNSVNAPYMKVGIWNSIVENFYLQQSSDLSASLGMDARLLQWAKETKKPVYEIESGVFQLKLLAGFSDELQEKLLEDTLNTSLLGYGRELQKLYDLWCAGDEEALTEYLQTDTSDMSKEEKALYKEYHKAMVTNRNKTMHKAAVKYLKSGETVFYAVGLAHLLGEDGLVESLRDAGYTVELVSYN